MKRALRIYGWAKQLFQCLYVFGEGLSAKKPGMAYPFWYLSFLASSGNESGAVSAKSLLRYLLAS